MSVLLEWGSSRPQWMCMKAGPSPPRRRSVRRAAVSKTSKGLAPSTSTARASMARTWAVRSPAHCCWRGVMMAQELFQTVKDGQLVDGGLAQQDVEVVGGG